MCRQSSRCHDDQWPAGPKNFNSHMECLRALPGLDPQAGLAEAHQWPRLPPTGSRKEAEASTAN